MDFRSVEKVGNPICYIAISIILSVLVYGIYDRNSITAVILIGTYFIYLLFDKGKEFTFLMSIFFIIGIVININYYNIIIADKFYDEIRIVETKSYYTIGEYKGRRFYVQSDASNIKLGDKLFIKGIFEEKLDKEKGIIGSIEIIKSKKLNRGLTGKLYDTREEIYKKLEDNLGKRKAGLVSSLAFGYSDYLDGEDKEDMRSFGIIHVISVSGLHVALIFSILSKFFNKKLSILGAILYVVFTGAPFSSIRSIIMIICLSSAFSVRKNYNPLASLSLSALIITLLKPYAPFQLGFILSFLATFGIIIFSSRFNNKFYKLPKYLRETVGISLGAQIFTLPVMMITFKEISISFLIGNLLIVPILNLIIILGNISLIAFMYEPLFDFISFILIKIIYFLDRCMDLIYSIGSATIIANKGMVFIYCISMISMYFIYKGYRKFVFLPIIAAIVVMIQIYSPVLKVDYLKEGGLLISYKGERTVITNKRNIDMAKLKQMTLSREGIREARKIFLPNGANIVAYNKDFILNLGKKEYLLRLNNRGEIDKKCDIINFIEEENVGFYIVDDRIILY